MERTHPWIEYLKNAKTPSESTRRQYIQNLQTLLGLAGDSKSLEFIVSHPRDMLRVIIARYSNFQTRKALIAAVKALFKYVPGVGDRYKEHQDLWHDAFKQLDKAIFQKVSTAEPSPRELQHWVSWKSVLAKHAELTAFSYGSIDHLLLSMYCMIEPLRADYGNVHLTREPVTQNHKEGNFMSLPPAHPQLVLNEYKTSVRYGQFRRELPTDLINIVLKSLEKDPREYLFVDESGRPYTKKNSYVKFANRILEKLFKKKFTIRMLRHSFISNIDFNEKTPGQLMQHSHNMLHSIAQQQLYRRKVEEPTIIVTKVDDSNSNHSRLRAQTNPTPAMPPPPPANAASRQTKVVKEYWI